MRSDKVTATMVLASVVEQSKWLEFVNSDDQRLSFDAMKILTQMRDGRPKQQINVEDERAAQDAADEAPPDEELVAEIEKELQRFTGCSNCSLAHSYK